MKNRLAVNSFELTSIGYDPKRWKLEAEFRTGEVYHYFDVPPTVYRSLLAAPSKGRYFNSHIRTSFHYERIRWVA